MIRTGAAPSYPALTDVDRTFLRALVDIPEDRTTWLVYADWLEDRDDPRAEFLRLVVARSLMSEGDPSAPLNDARLAQLRNELDPLWMAVFDPAPVVTCPATRSTPCGRVWTELASTDAPDIRLCHDCRNPVFYCHTPDEAEMVGSAGEVVALSTRVPPDQNPFPLVVPPPDTDEIEIDLNEFMATNATQVGAEAAPARPWWRFW